MLPFRIRIVEYNLKSRDFTLTWYTHYPDVRIENALLCHNFKGRKSTT